MKPSPRRARSPATIDELIANQKEAEALLLLKQFLNDYFTIFEGSTKDIHALFAKMNQIHSTIKFTMMHTSIKNEPIEQRCDCEELSSIPFLDVSCAIKEGKIVTDLHKKKTDKNQYLLPSSCHPKQTFKAIPFSLALRIVRICSDKEDRGQRLLELKEKLLARNYNRSMVESALNRARSVPRHKALKKVKKKKTNRETSLCCSL